MTEIHSLISFVEKLAAAEIAIQAETHAALDEAAKVIQRDAKRRIGHYQDAVGPFQDWADLTDETQAQRERMGFTPNDPLLRTGELKDSIVREVEGNTAVIGSHLDKAEYMEFGTKRVPPRPFLGPASFANSEKVQELIGEAAVRGLFLNRTAGALEQVHESLGYDMELRKE